MSTKVIHDKLSDFFLPSLGYYTVERIFQQSHITCGYI